MYAHFDGVVAEKLADSIVLDVNGVGYLLLVSAQTLSMAPSAGGRMKLYATLSVREDAMELFGFYSREEKRMFERLRSVSGVGPRMALSILSSMPLNDLSIALVAGDAAALTRVPGIGKKDGAAAGAGTARQGGRRRTDRPERRGRRPRGQRRERSHRRADGAGLRLLRGGAGSQRRGGQGREGG